MTDLDAARERHVKGAMPALCHHDPLNYPCDAARFRDALDEAEKALNGCIDRYSRTITAAADMQADLNNARAIADELGEALWFHNRAPTGRLRTCRDGCVACAALAKWEASDG